MAENTKLVAAVDLKSNWNEERFIEGLKFVKYLTGIKELKQEQEKALRSFIKGGDLYFSAPTGYGKSLIFQALPVIADHILDLAICSSTVLVISPLQSLMFDQVTKLNRIGITAAAIFPEQEESILTDIENGDIYSLVFTSPESILTSNRWRRLLTSESFASSCVAVVFDEAHIIVQWGMETSQKGAPFRRWYGKVGEIVSLMDSSVKKAAFTATASKATKASIFAVLNLKPITTFVVERNPVRSNLLFHVRYIGNDMNLECIFSAIIQELKDQKEKCKRTVIFVQTRSQTALIWRMFTIQLKEYIFEGLEENPHNRLVEMYHAGTPQKVKDVILEKMTSSGSCLRVLICTSAFGMGVDCKDVNRIVHFGPTKTIEAYLQECGRGGRDGKPSTCYLLYNGLLYGHCQDDIKKFIVSNECRRKKMQEIFPGKRNSSSVECACCDICLKKCHCETPCDEFLQFKMTSRESALPNHVRHVSEDQRERLKMELESLKHRTRSNVLSSLKPVSCPSVLLEFGQIQVEQVLQNCNNLFTLDDILSKVEIWRMAHARFILNILQIVFEDIDDDINLNDTSMTNIVFDSEEELDDEWMEIRDDPNYTLLENTTILEELDEAMENLDQSGPLDQSLRCFVDYDKAKPDITEDDPMT